MSEMKDDRIDVMNSCTEHIILYAKHWYGNSGNIMADLKQLLAEVTGVPTECATDNFVYEALANAWAEISPALTEMDRREGILEMLGWKWKGWSESLTRKPEEVLIGKLSILDPKKVKFVEGDKVDRSRMANISFKDLQFEEEKQEALT